MKQLFLTICWLELIRAKTRSLLLLVIIIACSFSLSTCGHVDADIHISSETTQSAPFAGSPSKPAKNLSKGDSNLMTAFPPLVITCGAFVLGFIVLMTIPFRGKQEWEDGQFQMIAMGDFSFYRVEFTRFLSYLLLAILFIVTVLLCSSIFCWKNEIFSSETIISLQWLVIHRFVSFMPLMLAFGVLVSAINTAYYQDGNGKILTLVKYISCFSFFVLAMKIGCWFEDMPYRLFPVLEVPINVLEVHQTTLTFGWEFMFLSLAVAALFVFWSGRVLEEVEA